MTNVPLPPLPVHVHNVHTKQVIGNSISAIAFFEGRLYAADYTRKCLWFFGADSDGSPDLTKPNIIAEGSGAEFADLVSSYGHAMCIQHCHTDFAAHVRRQTIELTGRTSTVLSSKFFSHIMSESSIGNITDYTNFSYYSMLQLCLFRPITPISTGGWWRWLLVRHQFRALQACED